MPYGQPGKFSTSVVMESWPPGSNLPHATFLQSETWDTHIYRLDNKITVMAHNAFA
jgi:hypothetical protein